MEEFITGLDIGTTKVCAVIGMPTEDAEIEILGVGKAPSTGLKKGNVINIDSTAEAILAAIEEAEIQSGVEVESVYTGVAGHHIQGENSSGVVAITSKDREITQKEVERVIELAQAVKLPYEREILHVIPYDFTVDNQHGIKDPAGMMGVRLETAVHIVTGSVSSAQNLIRSVNKAGFNVKELVLEPLASSEACLLEDEKEVGSIIIDIGGGTTDILVYIDGSVRYTSVLPIGGNNVTHDISIGLKTPESTSEFLKTNYGCALNSLINSAENIEVPSVGERKARRIPRHFLCEIIEPRMEEIFYLIYEKIKKSSLLDQIAGGIILTGGGSLLPGTAEIAERIFELPVRMGYPRRIKNLVELVQSPIYTTSVGLALYGLREEMYESEEFIYESEEEGFFSRLKKKFSSFTKDFFS